MIPLFLATFASEDLACVTAGALIASGRLAPLPAIAACAIGIVVGDVGLWAAGRAGRLAASSVWRKGADHPRLAALVEQVRSNASAAILASRFLPGTRLPLYLCAGAIGVPAWTFIWSSVVAASLWTPMLVMLAAGLAGGATSLGLASGWRATVLMSFGAAACAVPIVAAARTLAVPALRVRAAARMARWFRWEFWPTWIFYAPVAVWIAALSLRYRGLSTFTASNPAIPDGGAVGESKFDILARLPRHWIVPSMLVRPGETGGRLACLRERVDAAGWRLPLVLKPDVGQRGVGVKLIRSWSEAERYLAAVTGAVLAQPYDEGPHEAGVFYYRLPHWSRGRLLSITDKVFPEIVGDGYSTLETLIWQHPRYRLQARTFLRRHGDVASQVLAQGERFRLALAGNHAQGTTFRDGAHLMTSELERRIDEIAQSAPGFFIGRFDIRFRDPERFTRGLDFAIVELNGATAESTNIYDPDASLLSAYRLLFRQWSLVFAIGAANRSAGARVSSLTRLARLARAHLTTPVAYPISD
jgi:membrane protein DedA with SNARE-associated domain